MNDTEARLIAARLEAAFDRYNVAALSGSEPTMDLFLEALLAEGLEVSLREPVAAGTDARRGRDPLGALRGRFASVDRR